MIKAIFFDFDGVLTLNERGSTVTIKTIQEANPDLSAEKIQDCYYRFHTIPAKLGFKTYFFDPKQNDTLKLKSQLAEWGVQVSLDLGGLGR